MGNLILNSLEIRNFRGFQHLTIERLATGQYDRGEK